MDFAWIRYTGCYWNISNRFRLS